MKLFTEVFDAIERVFKAIKGITDLPRETRDELRNTFDETFKLLNTSLNMVIIRLGEILRITNDTIFITEVSQLSFDAGWTQAEREFRLCSGLRHVVSETERLKAKVINHISVRDWDDMQNHIQAIFLGEAYLGEFIANKFQVFSDTDFNQRKTSKQIRDELKKMQEALNIERRRLINMEIDLYDNF